MSKSNSTVLKRSGSTGKYLLALPSEVRAKTGLKDGDSLIITTTPDGRIILRPKSGSLRDLRGVVATRIHASDQLIRNACDGKGVPATDQKLPSTSRKATAKPKKK